MTRHSPAMPAVHAPKPKRRNLLAELVRSREATLFVVLIALVAATAAVKAEFLNLQNLRDVLLNVSIIGLLTAGMTVVMLMRHIDLSVASVVGVSAYSVGSLFVMFPHMPIAVAMLAGIAIGLAIGAVNGTLITFGRVPSLVATLSTLYIVRGADYAWVHGGQINATSLPDAFSRIATGSLLGLPNLVLIAVVVLLAIGVYLKQYRGGREHYAIPARARGPAATTNSSRVSWIEYARPGRVLPPLRLQSPLECRE